MKWSIGLRASLAWIVGSMGVALGVANVGLCHDAANVKSVRFDSLTLSIPNNLDIEKVASDPLVKWPIVADWDSQGRLVVAESGGVAKPIDQHNKQGLHRVVRLVDSDGDGKFDSRIVAAKDLAFPEGVLCVGNSILVSAPPIIWKLTDADGDGVCEQRDVWHDGQTITGCANDLHGPYMGRDGWIYWCKGAFAEQNYTLLNGKPLKTKASHIFRKRLEGGALEPVMSGGMDNPVEVAITPEGERFFTSTFLQHPGDGKRDGIAHAVYGGLHGKDNANAIDGHVRTGPLMPIMTHLGPAAPSGLICLESADLVSGLGSPNSSHRTLAAALFNLQRVTLHQLVPNGASFVTQDHNLVVSDRIDFHPTDIIEDADGSLLVIDTGGWYNLCCPSSKVDQQTAQGGIYRVSSPKTRLVKDARGREIRWESVDSKQALQMLGDSRSWVRRRASDLLVAQASESVSLLGELLANAQAPVDQRLEALWTLCRSGSAVSSQSLLSALSSESPSIRQAAAHAISVQRISEARQKLESIVRKDSVAAVRRSAAEALGRVGDHESVNTLMSAIAEVVDDRALEHSLLYAMIELGAVDKLAPYLASEQPIQQRAALMVLDQLKAADALKPEQVFTLLNSSHDALRAAAREVLSRHGEWASSSEAHLKALWDAAVQQPGSREAIVSIVGAWSTQATVQQLVGEWLTSAASAPVKRQDVLQAILTNFTSKAVAREWSKPIAQWLKAADANRQDALTRWLASLDGAQLADQELIQTIIELAHQSSSRPTSALRYISALPIGTKTDRSGLSALTVDEFLSREAHTDRDAATSALGRLQLDRTDALRVLDGLNQVEPLRLLPAIAAVNRLKDDELDARLLTQLAKLPAARTVSTDQIKNLYKNRKADLRSQADRTIEQLTRPAEDVAAKIEATLAKLKPGDPVRGYTIFRSEKAACSACHRVGYVGGNIGPELTKIGATRTRRDLLEAILFPSSRLEQSYQPTRILTADGQVHNGLVKRDTAEELELVVATGKSVTIPAGEVERRELSNLSIMPAGLEELISMDDLADLLALLEAAK